MRAFEKISGGLRLTGRVAGLLRPHASGQGRGFALGALLSVLLLAFRLAQPWPLKWIIDAVSGERVPWNAGFALLSVAYVAASIAAALCEYGQRLVVVGLANRTVYAFRRRLFVHLLDLPLAFHEQRGPGELLTRVVSDTSRLRRGVVGVLLKMCQNALLFVASVIVLLWINSLLALTILGFGIVAFAAMLVSNRKILSASRKARRREGKLASVVEEDLRGVRELQTFQPGLDPRFEEQNQRSLKGEQKVRRLEAGLLFRVDSLLAIALCLILWQGTRLITAGALTAGDLILFVYYTQALYRPFTQFARQASQTGRTVACAERLLHIMEGIPAVADGPISAGTPAGEIVFENVEMETSKKQRGGRKHVLQGVSFRAAPGERIAVMGSNGAGKSSLLRLAARLQDPDSGRIAMDGRDLREYTVSSLRGQISAVYQDALLFGLTVRQNVALGKPGAGDEEIARVVERSGAAEFVKSMRYGYDTVVRGGRLLSGGERQRLAVARALLRDGKIWLLDEPTASVDAPAELEQLLLDATQGRTTLWVTHNPATAQRLDRILLLEEGRVKFFGTPQEFNGVSACR